MESYEQILSIVSSLMMILLVGGIIINKTGIMDIIKKKGAKC